MWKTLKIICLIFVCCFSLLAYSPPLQAANSDGFNQNYIISDEEMADYQAMTLGEINDFLTNGPGKTGILDTYITEDIDGKKRLATEIIYNASQRHQINPKILLVLLQREKSLITDPKPEPHQLNWAMGYSCGDYARFTGFIPHFAGFGIQIDRAAWRIRYFLDRPWEFQHRRGVVSKTLRRKPIRPQNIATASLYNYAPRVWDNLLLWKIWEKWFVSQEDELEGKFVKTKNNPDIWLIEKGKRKLCPTPAIFFSHFPEKIKTIPEEILLSYQIGPVLDFPNWSLLRTPDGGIYLLADGKKRPIVSEWAFNSAGFRQEEVTPVSWEELERFPIGKPIASPYPIGALLQNKITGSVWYVEDGKRNPIWAAEILEANFPYHPLIKVNPSWLDKFPESEPMKFKDGTLIKLPDSSAVYLISESRRRPIKSQEVFEALGYQWTAVIEISESILKLHPLGSIIDITEAREIQECLISNS